MLPGMKTHANCIKFCPLLLKLKDQEAGMPPALIDLPYRIVFAVATIDQVLIYSTQSTCPLSIVQNLHYDSINDLSWMNNKVLAVASSDGFISFIRFSEECIGEPLAFDSELVPEDLRAHLKSIGEVSFKANVELAASNCKTQGFQKVAFKSKKPAPSNPPATSATVPQENKPPVQ
mmetsp:Transcript_17193/g.28962  ORF Transcript_17193/g.28962 Transcript_17193/m.28962 type:complete len:176 (+) Transcript_17193:62-589(+)